MKLVVPNIEGSRKRVTTQLWANLTFDRVLILKVLVLLDRYHRPDLNDTVFDAVLKRSNSME